MPLLHSTVHKKYKRGEDGETREKGEEGVQHDLPLSSSLPYTPGQISEKKTLFLARNARFYTFKSF